MYTAHHHTDMYKKCGKVEQLSGPALVAEWVKPLAAVHTGQGSLPVRVEA